MTDTTAVDSLFQIETGSLVIALHSLAGVLIPRKRVFSSPFSHPNDLHIFQLLIKPKEEFQLFVLKRLKIFWIMIWRRR